jgi:excisionase family DNA binding protein
MISTEHRPVKPAPLSGLPRAKVLTVSEVSQYLRVSQVTMYRMIRRGEFPAFRLTARIAGDWRINVEDLQRWLQTHFTSDPGAQDDSVSSPPGD